MQVSPNRMSVWLLQFCTSNRLMPTCCFLSCFLSPCRMRPLVTLWRALALQRCGSTVSATCRLTSRAPSHR